MEGFEYGHFVAGLDQVPGAAQAGWSAAHQGNFMSAGFDFHVSLLNRVRVEVIGNVTFQGANRHRYAFFVENAGAFALFRLRTNPAAHPWQGIVLLNQQRRARDISRKDQTDEVRDLHGYRTASHAFGILALQTSLGFLEGEFVRETKRDLLKIADAHRHRQFGHGLPDARGTRLLFGGSFKHGQALIQSAVLSKVIVGAVAFN